MKGLRAKFILGAGLILCLVGILVGIAAVLYYPRGLQVRLHNAGTEALRSVVVDVTGNSYPLGDLAPGSSVAVRVEPKGESNVEIGFLDAAGTPRRLKAEVYLEQGYEGTLSLELTTDRILKQQERIRVWRPQ